jgi:2-polyprenyl-6-methoxyphenol hydroxylase-like FAD-dependent oxidoreductase
MSCAKLQIGVVGGSIAGCCAAVELGRAGHSVQVFERAGALVGQGAGIGLLPATLDTLVKRNLVDATLPRLATREHVLLARTPDRARMGQEALRVSMPGWSVNWADLHRNLRARVPQGAYRTGFEVRAVEASSGGPAQLIMADGSRQAFDLVLFADGHASLGRRHVCPALAPAYRGYVLWRGVVDLAAVADITPLQGTIHRISYRGVPGHAVFYCMPSGQGLAAESGGLVNFACYLPVAADAVADLLVDRRGRKHFASLAAGELRVEEEARFKSFAREHLPEYFAEIVAQSRDTFLQAVFSVCVPRQHAERVCVLGDAATLVPPFTGSGVMKAVIQAIDLAGRLNGGANLAEALSAWDTRQTAFGRRLFELGEHMEKPFIWKTPDFSQLDPSAAWQWWHTATSLPPAA